MGVMMKPAMRIVATGVALLAAAPRVLAQGCAMCYTEAAAQGPGAARQLNFAILTLLIPSVLMFGGVLFAAFRRRERDLPADEPVPACEQVAPRKSIPESRRYLFPGASPRSS
jgi:hypothetical protein